jgi:septum formation protein
MTKPRLLLASSSPYRRKLLEKLKLDFEWAAPEIDETPLAEELPAALVCRLAEKKARQLAENHPNHLIIGSDQVATIGNRILGKPHTHTNAVVQLSNFCQQEVTFMTGLCLLNTTSNRTQISVEHYKVKFRHLTETQIENYLRKEQPYDCAGSFKAEGLGICLFERFEGEDPNTLVGLPLIALTRMLINEGVDPLS